MDAHRLTETGKRLYKRRKEAEERSFADVKELHGHRYIRFPECGEGAGSGVAGGGLPEHGEDGAPAGAPSALLGEQSCCSRTAWVLYQVGYCYSRYFSTSERNPEKTNPAFRKRRGLSEA